jgi:hypothetical protein
MDRWPLVVSTSDQVPIYVNNWFVCACPRNEVLQAALDESVRIIRARKSRGQEADLWQHTGTGVLTRNVVTYCMEALAVSPKTDPGVAFLSQAFCRSISGWEIKLPYRETAEGNWRFALR